MSTPEYAALFDYKKKLMKIGDFPDIHVQQLQSCPYNTYKVLNYSPSHSTCSIG